MRIQVLNWQKHFENSKSRERDRCGFVCVPNKMGMGLALMLAEPDGAAMYGIFCLMLGLLSRQPKPRDGYLTGTGQADDRYLTGSELALLWRRPTAEVDRALRFICTPNMSWAIDLDVPVPAEYPSGARAVPADCPPSTLEGRKEGNGRKLAPPSAKPARDPDPLWDCVAAIWFGATVKKPQATRVGKVVRDLKAYGATPAELRIRVDRYKTQWPDAECTPEAIVKHWYRFAGATAGAETDTPMTPEQWDEAEQCRQEYAELKAKAVAP